MSNLIDNSGVKLYFSKKGVPLLYVDALLDVPVITLENFPQGDLAVLMPDGTVREITHSEMIRATDNFGQYWVVDGVYHPHLLYKLADTLGATVDNTAILTSTGRWIETFPDKKFSYEDFKNPFSE